MNSNPSPNDWRRQGQEKYLKDKHLVFRQYSPFRVGWDHDHCEFCGRKFSNSPNDLGEGYSTNDGYHWICQTCFEDFKSEFGWITDLSA